MNDRKHTGGTWLPARLTLKQLNIIPVGNSYRCQIVGGEDGDARIVATVHGQTERECEANALLISAASDLLKAAKLTVEDAVSDDMDGWFRALKAAIARTEGCATSTALGGDQS